MGGIAPDEHLYEVMGRNPVGSLEYDCAKELLALREQMRRFLPTLPQQAPQVEAKDVPRHCPTCDSPQPRLHPAMQYEGEVQLCKDSWHKPAPTRTAVVTRGEVEEMIKKALEGARIVDPRAPYGFPTEYRPEETTYRIVPGEK